MNSYFEKICYDVVALARETGAFVKSERQKNKLSIESKGINDFVTHVDKGSEQRLVSGLKQILPEAGFIAEENTETAKGDVYNWVIDPIDGTTNFIHGLTPFAISIALMEHDQVVVGIVYEIGLDECFYAWKGGKAWLNGQPIKVSDRKTVSDSLVATGFPYTMFAQMNMFLRSLDFFMRKSHGIRRLGSAATDLAYVACGRFEAFYEYNLNPWDVAAGALLVLEAGGKMSDFKGGNNYIFGKELVATNHHVFDEFMDDVKQLLSE
ncbi:MAG: inositol monophosphatase family protein [Breznakibacter sp.]